MLSKEDILSRTNGGLEVFRHYVTTEWRLGKNFRNPFYDDKRASCNIYFDRKSRTYKMKDFGNDAYSGDCFDIVGKLRGLDCGNAKDFVEILETINQDLMLGLDDDSFSATAMPYPVASISDKTSDNILEPPIEPKKAKPYSAKQKPFTTEELEFWGQYGITQKALKAYGVSSIREYSSENKDDKPFTLRTSADEPICAYTGKRYVKIYRPHSELRFLYGGTLGDNYCFGLEQLPAKGDTLFITGGEKDVMSLASHGFHAICFNSETSKSRKSKSSGLQKRKAEI
jgi:hypothetical protein